MKTSLTIAGYDPTGLAGVTADILTFERLGVQSISLQTALTAQDGKTVKKVVPLPPALIKTQAELLLKTFKPDSVKIGMTGDSDVASVIADIIKKYKLKNIVIDTILKSTGGFPLAKKNSLKSLIKLISMSTIATPNIDEASAFTGIKIKTVEDMKKAAIEIHSMGCQYALIKGGHLKEAPVDILFNGEKFKEFEGKRIEGNKKKLHGTGCILSSAIAANLAKGRTVETSVEKAKEFLEESIKKRL